MGKRYITISIGILLVGAIFFGIGTKRHNPKKEFEEQKQQSIVKTGQSLNVLVVESTSNSVPKVLELFGEIDQGAITITANFSSVIKSI